MGRAGGEEEKGRWKCRWRSEEGVEGAERKRWEDSEWEKGMVV